MADDSYRGYGNGRGRGGSEPPTDPLTELARLIGQSDPFGHDSLRADPRASADSRYAAPQPAQQDDGAGYDDRYGPPPEPSQYPQDGYGNDGADGYAAQHDNGQTYADDGHHDGYPDPRGYAGAQYPQQPPPYQTHQNGSAYQPAQPNGQPSFAPPPHYAADPHAGRSGAYYDDAPTPRRRGWLVTAAALVGLA